MSHTIYGSYAQFTKKLHYSTGNNNDLVIKPKQYICNEDIVWYPKMFEMNPIDLSSLFYVVKRLNYKKIWPECEEIHNK